MEGYSGLDAHAVWGDDVFMPLGGPLNAATEAPAISMAGVIRSKNNNKPWRLELAKMPVDDRRGNVARLTIAGSNSGVADLAADELITLASAMLDVAAELKDREVTDGQT